jgi:hypothetical protein
MGKREKNGARIGGEARFAAKKKAPLIGRRAGHFQTASFRPIRAE